MKKLSPKAVAKKIAKMQKGIRDGSIKIESEKSKEITDIENNYPAYLEDFFLRVLKMRYWDCFITDKSSLHDFPEKDKVYIKRIKESYGVNINSKDKLYIHELIFKIFPRQ